MHKQTMAGYDSSQRAQYMSDSTRGEGDHPSIDLFKHFVGAQTDEERRASSRQLVKQSIADSIENGDSFDVDKHYSTPQVKIGRYENIYCKMSSE